MRAAIALLLAAAPLVAQPHDEAHAKGGAYADRLKDEIRARKMYERSARAAIPPRFRDALEHYQPSDGDLAATWGEFRLVDGTPFGALQLALPANVDAATVTFFGIVGGATYFEDLPVQHSGDDAFVERSLLLEPGVARGVFGLARKNEILGLAHVDIEPPSELSRLILSSDVHNLAAAQDPLDPFAFGGTKVVPKPRATFRRGDEVWLFLEMRSATPPQLTARVDVGDVRGTPTPAEALPLKGVPGHFGIGNTIDVSRLAPGDYRVRVTLTDAASNKTLTREATLRITGAPRAPRP
jgi:hypothetical protein